MKLSPENVRIAVALRAARTAIGWSQQEFADRLDVAKSTVARIETLEMVAKADFLMKAIAEMKKEGIDVDLVRPEGLVLFIGKNALSAAGARLANDEMRRTDRKQSPAKQTKRGDG